MHTDRLGDVVMTLYKNIKTKLERELRHYDIGMGQMQILMIFFSNEYAHYTQSELANITGVDKGNISRSVYKLVDKAYIQPHEKNKRYYQMTPKGVQLKSEIIPILANLHNSMSKDIDARDLMVTFMTLTKLSNNLEETV
ncbi:MarR family winged helix-turn-helix transcriptional regulator [Fusibacter sp. JL298sf-3]